MPPSSFHRLLGAIRRLFRGGGRQPAAKQARQVAALPVRVEADGTLSVLLITARRSNRAIVPKGWPMKSKPDHRAAAIEAEEEAGVVGMIHPEPIGSYVYRKRGARLSVDVYLLDVRRHLPTWREKGQRRLFWLSIEEAAKRIDEPGLVPIIRELPAILHRATRR